MEEERFCVCSTSKRFLALIMVFAISITSLWLFDQPVSAKKAKKADKAKEVSAPEVEKWGVFIGTCIHGNKKKVEKYKNVVIDAQYYTKKEIKKLKQGKKKVYSYLSVGSLGKYRSYYNYFSKYLMGDYNNWGDEDWIDVSQVEWQNFLVDYLVRSYQKKGIYGLWIDNTDVYYEYPREEIFQGLVNILVRLRQKRIPVIINGGDVFVTELINRGYKWLIKGVMQEEVITRIADYNRGRFAWQTIDDRIYFMEYCQRAKQAGLKVSLLEYSKSRKGRKKIIKFCKKYGYTVYIANNVQLK